MQSLPFLVTSPRGLTDKNASPTLGERGRKGSQKPSARLLPFTDGVQTLHRPEPDLGTKSWAPSKSSA